MLDTYRRDMHCYQGGRRGIEFPTTYMDKPSLDNVITFFEDMNNKYKRMLEEIRKTDTLLVIARREK